MALNSNALITLYELGDFIGHSVVAAQSGSYETMVNATSEYIETECNRTFLSGSMATEIFDGKGYADNIPAFHTEQVLEQAPITTSTTPKLYLWDGDSWEAVTASSYTYNADDGTIYFPGSVSIEYDRQPGYVGGVGNYFIEGKSNYRVVYAYGYDGVANIPSDLKMLTVILIKRAQTEMDHAGTVSSNISDRSKTYALDTMPLMAQKTINKYIR